MKRSCTAPTAGTPVATWPELRATAGIDRIWNGDEDVATVLADVQAEVTGQLSGLVSDVNDAASALWSPGP